MYINITDYFYNKKEVKMPRYTVSLYLKDDKTTIIGPFYCINGDWVEEACKQAFIDKEKTSHLRNINFAVDFSDTNIIAYIIKDYSEPIYANWQSNAFFYLFLFYMTYYKNIYSYISNYLGSK